MQSSGDSSIWRSLAVAFGDGLAFGVGMKLTQKPARQAATPSEAELTPATSRLEQIERRVERMERAPAARPGAPSAPFDQKVLDTVFNALDARLKEHAGQVERRITGLEAQIAVEVQALHRQDQSLASGAREWIEDAQRRFDEQLAAFHTSVEQDLSGLHGQMLSLHREFAEAVAGIVEEQVASRLAALEQALERKLATAVERHVAAATQAQLATLETRVAATLNAQMNSLDQRMSGAVNAQLASLEQRVAAALDTESGSLDQRVTGAVNAQIASLEERVASTLNTEINGLDQRITGAVQTQFAPLERQVHAEMDQKDRELAELRMRLAESDRTALDLLLAIGEMCRQAAGRMAGPAPPSSSGATLQAAVAPEPVERKAPVREPAPPPPETPASERDTASPSEPGDTGATGGDSLPVNPAPADNPFPGFAQPKADRLWRIPLLSSLLLATGSLLLLHFW
jgi:hypothetical protein